MIYLAPQYVEGWNQRATLHFQMGNYRKSMSDINRVLAIEPRHFGALAGMAAILTSAEQDELALKAWEQFLAIYPADRNAQDRNWVNLRKNWREIAHNRHVRETGPPDLSYQPHRQYRRPLIERGFCRRVFDAARLQDNHGLPILAVCHRTGHCLCLQFLPGFRI